MVMGGGGRCFISRFFSRLRLFFSARAMASKPTRLLFCFFAVEWLTVTCNLFLRHLPDSSGWADLLLWIWLPTSLSKLFCLGRDGLDGELLKAFLHG